MSFCCCCSGSFSIILCLKYIMLFSRLYHPHLFWKEIAFSVNSCQHSRSVTQHCLWYHSVTRTYYLVLESFSCVFISSCEFTEGQDLCFKPLGQQLRGRCLTYEITGIWIFFGCLDESENSILNWQGSIRLNSTTKYVQTMTIKVHLKEVCSLILEKGHRTVFSNF